MKHLKIKGKQEKKVIYNPVPEGTIVDTVIIPSILSSSMHSPTPRPLGLIVVRSHEGLLFRRGESHPQMQEMSELEGDL